VPGRSSVPAASVGYLAPGGQLVVQPGYTSDLTGPMPRRLVEVALNSVPPAGRASAYPLFDVSGASVGYLAGPVFHAQAVAGGNAARTAEVMVARDPAELIPRGQPAPQPLTRGARLGEGDRVRTGRGGAAELRLADGSLVRLGELSEFEIERLEVDAQGMPRQTQLALAVGKLRAHVTQQLVARASTTGSGFSVRTPTLVAAVRQTDFAVVQPSQGPGRSYTFEGAVENRGTTGNVTCRADQYTEVRPNDKPTPCGAIPPAEGTALLQELAFETPVVSPAAPTAGAGPYIAAGAAVAVFGGLGGAAAAGAFDTGGGSAATSLRPRR
jgi:hypothetical protein